MYCGSPSPLSIRSLSFAWAMSRPTMIVPLRDSCVVTGYFVSSARISFIGRLRSILTTPCSCFPRYFAGMSRPGLRSSSSSQIPSLVIFAFTFRSAEQETPIPTGQEAPWRGRRMTRTSRAKYFPPNCAPYPDFCAALRSFSSISTSRNACPPLFPDVGKWSKYFVEASFTAFRHASAEVPPTTNARWYGGHAAVPSVFIFSTRNFSSDAGLSSAFVSWKRYILFADPPPLVTKRNLYSIPFVAYRSICAGRLVPEFTSSYIVSGTVCEYRMFSSVYILWISFPSNFFVETYSLVRRRYLVVSFPSGNGSWYVNAGIGSLLWRVGWGTVKQPRR